MSIPSLQTSNLTLVDVHPTHKSEQPIRLVGTPLGVNLLEEGYGDFGSAVGHGAPVFLEQYNGALRLVIWTDINSEEPSHIIDLGGAREDRRRPDDE